MDDRDKQAASKVAKARNLVPRADGKMINVFRRPGQLFVCGFG
jgi:hypothetical protein